MTPDIVARRVGQEEQPVVVIDGFHPDPDALRAAGIAGAWRPGERHYPGVRADLPADYLCRVRPVIALVLRDVFGLRGGVDVLDASFSLVTKAPGELTLPQRLPHVDAVEPGRIALVHYLAPGEGDGTAFFRHRATGYETIDAARGPGFYEALRGEVEVAPPTGYVHDDTPLFARTALIPAHFNRAVIYRSAMLHSGAIADVEALSADPAAGRLTVTAFLAGV
jgi:hypothetical protein